jgi:hypothetical protein
MPAGMVYHVLNRSDAVLVDISSTKGLDRRNRQLQIRQNPKAWDSTFSDVFTDNLTDV